MKRSSENFFEPEPKRQTNGYLSLFDKRGEGNYGTVYRCKFQNDHKWRAIKILKLNQDPNNEDEVFMCDMPPVIRDLIIGGTCDVTRSGVIQFTNNMGGNIGTYGIISELAHCTLRNVAPGMIPIHAVRILGKALLLHLEKIHFYGAMHRDIKPDNVLLTWKDDNEWPNVEIIDYGLSITGLSSFE